MEERKKKLVKAYIVTLRDFIKSLDRKQVAEKLGCSETSLRKYTRDHNNISSKNIPYFTGKFNLVNIDVLTKLNELELIVKSLKELEDE